MQQLHKTFMIESRRKAEDLDHRRKINFSLKQSDTSFQKGKLQFSDLETARNIANSVKWETIEHLDKYLLEFEKNFTGNGGEVIWAENIQQAQDAVWKICVENNAKRLVKSKSMVTEENSSKSVPFKQKYRSSRNRPGRIYTAIVWGASLSFSGTFHA
jgi:L-lactate dehydrogenase complex protein LldF